MGDEELRCKICNKACRRPYDLRQHEKVHLNMREFQCGICGERFNTKNNHTNHMRKRHKIKASKPVSSREKLSLQIQDVRSLTPELISSGSEDDQDIWEGIGLETEEESTANFEEEKKTSSEVSTST